MEDASWLEKKEQIRLQQAIKDRDQELAYRRALRERAEQEAEEARLAARRAAEIEDAQFLQEEARKERELRSKVAIQQARLSHLEILHDQSSQIFDEDQSVSSTGFPSGSHLVQPSFTTQALLEPPVFVAPVLPVVSVPARPSSQRAPSGGVSFSEAPGFSLPTSTAGVTEHISAHSTAGERGVEVLTSNQEGCWIGRRTPLQCAPANAEARIGLISKPQTPPFVGGRQGILQYPAFKAHFKYFVHDVLTCEATKLSILRACRPQSVREEIGESVLTHPHNYWLVLEELESRYNRPHLVARAYFQELVSPPPVPVDHRPALLSFCRKVSSVITT